MDRVFGLSLLLVLLLFDKNNSEASCPARCQCFTPAQVLCADERMSSLPKNVSRQVKEFILMTSSVSYLFINTLQESPQLTTLILLNNALRSIHVHALDHLTELQELEISGNPMLEHLFLGTFSKQSNLTKLLLNFNRFRTVLPGMFDSLKQLHTLQMKGNLISQLPPLIFLHLPNLRVLDLSQNKLTDLRSDIFSGLDRLEVLKINNNLISNLTSDMFQNISQLAELNLEGNQITELSENVFSGLAKLQVLNLRGNLLTTFSDEVLGSDPLNLKELNLKGNRLTEVTSLSRLTSLTDLILSSNQLFSLPEDAFKNLTNLETVDLSENQLSSLPETIFHQLFNIKAIHLNKNNLSKVEANLFQDQMLIQQLYLSDNQLETLPFGLMDTFVLQHIVRLHGNPWKCDCHMWYMHDWVLKYSQDIEMLDNLLCDSPDFLRRHTVISVAKDQLVCQISEDHLPDLSRCVLHASGDTMTIKCRVTKCSPLTVKVQFQEDGGSLWEHVIKNQGSESSNCSNETTTGNPFE
ncbi:carboxypeptidase N subunit 2 [Sphaeramia orbicularis]|uniref:carboxypeptidase N subunit 2 n=1 Tax=Sphaeramia orbicularis TaxID=375764 RepID=UPI0011810897|nr:carboxypeptidase N subunit 2-like [Sphaeramia orbicularis]